MLKTSAAAWIVAVMLPASYVGYKSAATGKFFGVPLTKQAAGPRPVRGVPPRCGHPPSGPVAQAEDPPVVPQVAAVVPGEDGP
ncbi:MAG: hypothetical protein U0800_15455 [Isosphaeraceae bacterium]